MITIDRDKARTYVDGILADADPPYNKPASEEELDTFITMISEPGNQECDSFFHWIDSERAL